MLSILFVTLSQIHDVPFLGGGVNDSSKVCPHTIDFVINFHKLEPSKFGGFKNILYLCTRKVRSSAASLQRVNSLSALDFTSFAIK